MTFNRHIERNLQGDGRVSTQDSHVIARENIVITWKINTRIIILPITILNMQQVKRDALSTPQGRKTRKIV